MDKPIYLFYFHHSSVTDLRQHYWCQTTCSICTDWVKIRGPLHMLHRLQIGGLRLTVLTTSWLVTDFSADKWKTLVGACTHADAFWRKLIGWVATTSHMWWSMVTRLQPSIWFPVLGIPTRQTRETKMGSACEPYGMPWSTMGDGHPTSSNIRSQDWLVCHYCRSFFVFVFASQGIVLQDTNWAVESWTRKSWWHWSNYGCTCH